MTLRQRLQTVWSGRRSRRWLILSLLGVLLLLSFPAAYVTGRVYSTRWDSIGESATKEALEEAATAFGSVQRSARRSAAELAQNAVVREVLAGRRNGTRDLFRAVKRTSDRDDAGIEIYDRNGTLVAWEGPGGPAHRREILIALDGQMSSYVDRTALVSQLFVTTPVRESGRIVGVVLYRATVEFHAPVGNAILHRDGLSERLSRDLGMEVRFSFEPHEFEHLAGAYRTQPLYGIDSARVGTVGISVADRRGTLDRLFSMYAAGRAALLILFLALGGTLLWERLRLSVSPFRAVLAGTAVIWISRYLLLLLEVPSSFARGGIFDPTLFASPFGGGLARSIGEMGLTVAAVVLTVGLAAARLIPPLASWVKSGGLRGRLWGWIPAIALTALLFWLFRGYVAVIRSAVFDSTLPYGDLRPLVPSFELAVMIINLILLSLALVVVGSGTALAVAGMLAGGRPDRAGLRGTVLLFLVAPFLAWALSHDPLVGWMARLLFAITAITGAVMLMRRAGPPPSWRLRGGLLVTFGLSALVLLPVLSEMVDARERWRVETYAREVLRPIDTWLSYVVGETLLGFHTQEVREVLSGGGPDDLNQLAFTVWARSVACREGYPAVLAVTDTARMEVSRFTIGGESEAAASLDAELRLVDTTTQLVRLAGQGVNSIRLYGGVTPITDTSGAAFGFARLILTAGRRSLFRGGAPSILRATGQQGDDPFRDRIILSEFHEGVLLTSGSELFPVGYVLPVNVRRAFEDPSTGSFWSKHVVDERTYGSLFVRRDPESVVALSLLDLGPVRLLVGAEQMLGYYAVAMTLAGLLWLAYRAVRGQRLVFTFRDRLLAALLLTAIVPLVLISLYGRYDAGERLMQETARLLDDQTAAVSANLLSAPGGGVEALAAVTPPVVEAIASELGLDFNVYVDSLLVITSRPELYDLGILERRMPGSAYAATLLGGRRFHVEAEQIGAAQYAVGYRLMLDQEGLVAGTVSVPTAYRQEEIEEAVVRRNAFLLGVYVMVLVSLVVLAMLLANRIAAPIHRLTDATRLVARGDFDVSVRTSRTPAPAGGDEIDQLVASFEAMTRDLKKNREELIHYERELAWKEMAKQVAHEIKNPLTPMRLAVQHLRQTYRDRVEDFESVLDRVTGTVLEQIESLSRIASEFSHFARLPRRRIERCDLNAVVQESLGLCRQEGSTEFSLRLDPAEPAVEGDREELRRAFINVIKNGMQAMGGAGSMEIVTESGDDMATVLVHDTGPGIPEEVRVRLFEPNFSTKTEGMGLGLAIVKKTVDDMQGTITVESEPGQGTTVRITLPRAGDGK